MNRLIVENRGGEPSQHRKAIAECLAASDGDVRVVSPYITDAGFSGILGKRKVLILTTLTACDIVAGATKLNTINELVRDGCHLRFLDSPPKLHGKIYLFGESHGILTSANFTRNGMDSNLELGVKLSEEETGDLVDWFDRRFAKARMLSPTILDELESEANSISASGSLSPAIQELDRKFDVLKRAEVQVHWLSDSLDSAAAWFICNTNRNADKKDFTSVKSAKSLEEAMKVVGAAAIWPKCKWFEHMEQVKKGDIICMFAKGVGFLGVGRAKSPCNRYELNKPATIRYFTEKRLSETRCKGEWQVPVDWLAWNPENPLVWPGAYPFSFQNVTEKAEMRSDLKRHFSNVAVG